MDTTKVKTKKKWVIDPDHSHIGFRVKHLGFSNVRGSFKEFDANIYTSGDDFINAEINFWLNPASIHTGAVDRDKHLKSEDFFNIEEFKVISFFASGFIGGSKKNSYDMKGDLNIKGIKNVVQFDVLFGGIIMDPLGNDKAVFHIIGKLNRKDWGLNWNAPLESGGVLVSEAVWIECDVQLIKTI